MDIPSSEMTKYAANAFLATKISFINDISNLCERTGANVNFVRKGIGSDPRIGDKFIYPGIGYGGSCFPKDVKALIKTGSDFGHPLRILESVENVNESQKEVLFNKLKKYFNNELKDKKIAIWGISFKPNTDDMREAPSITIINNLLKSDSLLYVHDPIAMEEAKHYFNSKNLIFCDSYLDTVNDVDAILLITEWSEYRLPNWKLISEKVRNKVVFDGRNLFDSKILNQFGFDYYGIGLSNKNL